jgi:hypothetical protein
MLTQKVPAFSDQTPHHPRMDPDAGLSLPARDEFLSSQAVEAIKNLISFLPKQVGEEQSDQIFVAYARLHCC